MARFKTLFLTPLLLFVFINIVLVVLACFLSASQFNEKVLLIANGLCFAVQLLILLLQQQALKNPNPNVFVRTVIGGMMIKMFAAVITVALYFMIAGTAFDAQAVIFSLVIYLIYLAAEVSVLSKELRKKNVEKGS